MANIEIAPLASQSKTQSVRGATNQAKIHVCRCKTATRLVFVAIAGFWVSLIWWVGADSTDLHYHHAIIGATIYLLARFLTGALKTPSAPQTVQFYILHRAYFPRSPGGDIALLCTPLYLYMIYLSRRPGWGNNFESDTTIGQCINWMTLLSFVFSASALSALPKMSPYFDFGSVRVWAWTALGATVFTYLGSFKAFDFAITSHTHIPQTAKKVFIAIIAYIGALLVWWARDMCKNTNTGSAWWLEALGCVSLGVVINGLATYGVGDLKLANTRSQNNTKADACGIAAIVCFGLILAPQIITWAQQAVPIARLQRTRQQS